MFEKVNAGHPDKMADRLAGAGISASVKIKRPSNYTPPSNLNRKKKKAKAKQNHRKAKMMAKRSH